MASLCESIEVIKLLIASDITVKTPYLDTTPLFRTVATSYPSVVEIFIRAEANVDQIGLVGLILLQAALTIDRTRSRSSCAIES